MNRGSLRHTWRCVIPAVAALGLLLALSGVAAADPPSRFGDGLGDAEEGAPAWVLPVAHNAGLLLLVRAGCSALWPDYFDITEVNDNARIFSRSWSEPPTFDLNQAPFEWDHDPWTINVIGHGLMWSESYLVYRRSGYAWWHSLLMTTAWSFAWEYLVEAWHKHPSGIDLIWSPVAGGLLGEGRYQLLRLIRSMDPAAGRNVLLYLIDPLGQLERDALGLAF